MLGFLRSWRLGVFARDPTTTVSLGEGERWTARRGRVSFVFMLFAALVAGPSSARATVTIDVEPDRSRVSALADAARDRMLASAANLRPGSIVVRITHELPESAPRRRELVNALVAPTLEALRSESARFPTVHVARFEGEDRAGAERAHRLGYVSFLDFDVRVVGNFVHLDAAAWDAESGTRNDAIALRSRLDVELRQYLGALPRVSDDTVVARAIAMPSRGYLALSVEDLDGDGQSELVAISERTASILRFVPARGGARLSEVSRAAMPNDLPSAPSLRRRALATAVRTNGTVVFRTSAHAAPLAITLTGGRAAMSRSQGPCADDRFPLEGACASLVIGRDFFDELLLGMGPESSEHRAPALFYSRAFRRLRQADGSLLTYEAVVTPAGRLAVRIGERSASAFGYGTALAMGDLDEDGAAELLSSQAQPEGAGDQLSLLRALPRGAVHVVWRSEALAGSVWVATSGDLDGDGIEELLAVEEPAARAAPRETARLWIVH